MGLPTINVTFKKLASTAQARSMRGVLCVVVQDSTTTTFDHKAYTALEEVGKADYTTANYDSIARAFAASPYKVIVVRIGTSGTIADAEAILDTLSYNWLCAVPTTLQGGIVTYVKKINTASRVRKVKALVTGQTGVDDAHIVNVANTTVTLNGASATLSMALYLPRLAAVLAACPMTESVTYYALSDLDDVAAIADVGASVDAGNLCLFKDDDTIRVARGVNTLQTLTGDATEPMKKIAVVEAMDIIQEDIIRTFKTSYLGKMKNTLDNQALFISNVTDYFRTLADEGILYADKDPAVMIDVPAMRAAWKSIGVDVTGLTDAQVKRKPFRSQIFVSACICILDAMEDLNFDITMSD